MLGAFSSLSLALILRSITVRSSSSPERVAGRLSSDVPRAASGQDRACTRGGELHLDLATNASVEQGLSNA